MRATVRSNFMTDSMYPGYVLCHDVWYYVTVWYTQIVTWIEAGVLFLLLIWFVLVNLLNCATTCCRPPKNKPTKL